MADLNSISVTGRLGATPQLKFTQGGQALWSARIAVNGWKKGDVVWLNVSVWGKRAEGLGKLELGKGARVGVTGRLTCRTFENKEGKTVEAFEIQAVDVALLIGEGNREPSRGAPPDRAPPKEREAPTDAPDDDGIPF